MEFTLPLSLAVIGSLLADCLAHPRRSGLRQEAGLWLTALSSMVAFGLFLALSGDTLLAALTALALQVLLVVSSNAKLRILGEPLHFSDLALFFAVFQHPQFYFSALSIWQKIVGLAVLASLIAAFVWRFDTSVAIHLGGATIAVIGIMAIALSLRLPAFRKLAARPDAEGDVAKLGLVPTLLLYWLRWRGTPPQTLRSAEPHAATVANEAEIVIAIQCESFADPVELFGDRKYALPALESARLQAAQWGNLLVSGFGAYTMRTEYGVLFGREEEALGFCRYDPFLTAAREAEWALPHRLGTGAWRSLFVHPHDMRFYNRHAIMPAAGFAELVSEDAFAPPLPGEGRYVTDKAVADKILQLAQAAEERRFIYAVTIENHGPWSVDGALEDDSLLNQYLRRVQASDAMLGQLLDGLAALRRPAVLAFFGDHRPSIPGLSQPGGPRHTPYVILKLDRNGDLVPGTNAREDITPAQLHRAILGMV
ncbi:LTA synthase family protein [Aurantiacibacter xanthus]|uniref:LTA synthase family protein n=1 Tax=Aurantiacibacter xanthus TaxID=1784712 RepID=A0A3A1P3X4_9SPHN|nr:LTA synthase family protein [Aurantiacibacter xanthus]RIV83495.1 LTA synthase family protein [Aurantiacibacter xanthus]